MSSSPPPGTMVFWRFKEAVPGPWRFGYVTHKRPQLIRMGCWNGDSVGGSVVDPSEIEWRPYT